MNKVNLLSEQHFELFRSKSQSTFSKIWNIFRFFVSGQVLCNGTFKGPFCQNVLGALVNLDKQPGFLLLFSNPFNNECFPACETDPSTAYFWIQFIAKEISWVEIASKHKAGFHNASRLIPVRQSIYSIKIFSNKLVTVDQYSILNVSATDFL